MSGFVTVFDVPVDAQLPTLSRVLYMRGRGHTGMPPRPSKDHELHFVSHGKLTLELEGTDIVIPAGQILYTGPPTRYGVSASASANLSCFHCHFSLPGAQISRVDQLEWVEHAARVDAFAAGRERSICLPRQWAIQKPLALTELFVSLMNDQRGRRQGDAVAAQARFLLLLRAISHDAMEAPFQQPSIATPTSRAHVARALDLIERKPGRATLSGIASVLGIEPEYLARLFRQQVGCSLGRYAVRRAMAAAQERLLSGAMTVREIGRWLGYSDALYFSRVFKREVGHSPREFRNRTLR